MWKRLTHYVGDLVGMATVDLKKQQHVTHDEFYLSKQSDIIDPFLFIRLFYHHYFT